jgi:hypothetical protein
MVLDAAVNHQRYFFVDEACFNLAKTHRSTGNRPSAWTKWGKHLHVRSWGGRTWAIVFLNEIEQACQGQGVTYVIVNVRIHHKGMVSGPSLICGPIPAQYSHFLNHIEELFFQHEGGPCTITIP